MRCPKCGQKMHGVQHSLTSSLEETVSVESINGMSCIMCGKFVDAGRVKDWVERQIEHPPKQAAKVVPQKAVTITAQKIVRAQFADIRKQRKEKKSWKAIADKMQWKYSIHCLNRTFSKILLEGI